MFSRARTHTLPLYSRFVKGRRLPGVRYCSALCREVLEAAKDDDSILERIAEELPSDARTQLYAAIQRELYDQDSQAKESALSSNGASFLQHWRLALMHGVPMIGFGFVDNFLLIIAGDYIDSHVCLHLGLTTMFAAAVGNIMSDIGGLTLGGFLEKLGNSLGLKHHNMSIAQLRTWKAWWFKYTGMVIGITTGCIIGMIPLLYPEKYRLWNSRQNVEKALLQDSQSSEDRKVGATLYESVTEMNQSTHSQSKAEKFQPVLIRAQPQMA